MEEEEFNEYLRKRKFGVIKEIDGKVFKQGVGICDVFKDHRKGIVRNEIYFSRTSGVSEQEYDAVIKGFKKIMVEAERVLEIRDFGCFKTGEGEYSSPDWYQEQALMDKDTGCGRQVNAYTIDHLLRIEPYQEQNPHFDVMVVDKDLTVKDYNLRFIFGHGPYPNNTISVRRFRDQIDDDRLRYQSISVLSAHEFGHNLGLVERDFNVGYGPLEGGIHCDGDKGPCLMEQVNVSGRRSINEQAKELASRKNWLCPDCLDEIRYRREWMKEKGMRW